MESTLVLGFYRLGWRESRFCSVRIFIIWEKPQFQNELAFLYEQHAYRMTTESPYVNGNVCSQCTIIICSFLSLLNLLSSKCNFFVCRWIFFFLVSCQNLSPSHKKNRNMMRKEKFQITKYPIDWKVNFVHFYKIKFTIYFISYFWKNSQSLQRVCKKKKSSGNIISHICACT